MKLNIYLSGAVLLASLIMTPRSGAVAAYPGLLKEIGRAHV